MIKAKSLKTILSKLNRKEKELAELNGKLDNPICLNDISDLIKYYSEQAQRIKVWGVKIEDCYKALIVSVNSWAGNLPKRYKYKKQFVSAMLSMDNDGNFSLRIFRNECYAGSGICRHGVWIKDTDMVKKEYAYIINKLLEE